MKIFLMKKEMLFNMGHDVKLVIELKKNQFK